MNNFVHLHVHTEYSLLDGLIKIPDLLAKVKEHKMSAVAVTDHGAMYSAFKFYREATSANIKPIIGMEAYQAKNSLYDKPKEKDYYHITLLCKNEKGYKNLMKLTSKAHLEGYHRKPRIDLDLLTKYSEGLVCLSGCLQSKLARLIIDNKAIGAQELVQRFLKIFPEEHFYFEMQKHPKLSEQEKVNKELIKLSRKYGVPLAATNDVHYLEKKDAKAHEILLCIQTGHTILEKNRPLSMINSPDFYFRSPSEMKELFSDFPEAVENTNKIADMCSLKIQEGKFILPPFSVPKGLTHKQFLEKESYKKLKQKYQKANGEIKKRLDYEIKIISEKGYTTYFLIFADFVNWAKNNGIAVGPGRGSAAGSIVSYLLGITQLDPIYHDIPFERFLNPDRPSPPDIDLDFADDRRDEVIQYVVNKYGKDKVAQIITFGTMEARQAIRDVGRALGMPYSQPDRIAKLIPYGKQGFKIDLSAALSLSQELNIAYSSEEDTKKLVDLAIQLEGVARHASVHAAGVVISDKPLQEYTPLQKEPRGTKIITQYDMYSLDINSAPDARAVGLLKMDFLGLRNLTILQSAISYVQERKHKKIIIENLPLDDKKVYDLISSGQTTGVFQLESRGMRNLAKKLKPSKFTDISAMVALFRPGPMAWIDDFIAGKQNPQTIKYPHKDLKSILSETYGIAVYQEQCMQIANQIAGYTMAGADRLRYAIGKKKKSAMEKEKNEFIKGCVNNGYSKYDAENIWSLIEKFVGYGFNKAHSASYGMIAYQTAYMKAHYPVEFMTAVFSAEGRAASGPIRDQKMARAVDECRRMDIALLPPDINKSKPDFTIKGSGIRFGLSAIKNIGFAAIQAILSARKNKGEFLSLRDFVLRVNLSKVNKKTLESLIQAGAMDLFGTRAGMLLSLADILSTASRLKKQRDSGQVSMFEEKDSLIDDNENPSPIPEFSKKEILVFEKKLLGFYLTEHPLTPYEQRIEKEASHAIGDLGVELDQKKVKIGGIISNVKKITTRRDNQEMAFARIEDKTGSIETVVFPKIYESAKNLLERDRVVILTGTVSERDSRISILVEKISAIA